MKDLFQEQKETIETLLKPQPYYNKVLTSCVMGANSSAMKNLIETVMIASSVVDVPEDKQESSGTNNNKTNFSRLIDLFLEPHDEKETRYKLVHRSMLTKLMTKKELEKRYNSLFKKLADTQYVGKGLDYNTLMSYLRLYIDLFDWYITYFDESVDGGTKFFQRGQTYKDFATRATNFLDAVIGKIPLRDLTTRTEGVHNLLLKEFKKLEQKKKTDNVLFLAMTSPAVEFEKPSRYYSQETKEQIKRLVSRIGPMRTRDLIRRVHVEEAHGVAVYTISESTNNDVPDRNGTHSNANYFNQRLLRMDMIKQFSITTHFKSITLDYFWMPHTYTEQSIKGLVSTLIMFSEYFFLAKNGCIYLPVTPGFVAMLYEYETSLKRHFKFTFLRTKDAAENILYKSSEAIPQEIYDIVKKNKESQKRYLGNCGEGILKALPPGAKRRHWNGRNSKVLDDLRWIRLDNIYESDCKAKGKTAKKSSSSKGANKEAREAGGFCDETLRKLLGNAKKLNAPMSKQSKGTKTRSAVSTRATASASTVAVVSPRATKRRKRGRTNTRQTGGKNKATASTPAVSVSVVSPTTTKRKPTGKSNIVQTDGKRKAVNECKIMTRNRKKYKLEADSKAMNTELRNQLSKKILSSFSEDSKIYEESPTEAKLITSIDYSQFTLSEFLTHLKKQNVFLKLKFKDCGIDL